MHNIKSMSDTSMASSRLGNMTDQDSGARNRVRQMLNKVPEITLYFWIIKVLCTTVGETASDFLNVNLNFGLTGTSIVMGIMLFIVLFFQFRSEKYIPSIYWLTVVLISIFGTLVTDNLTDSMGVPLEVSTIFFSIVLALTFLIWYVKEKTLSVHSIVTRQREFFYWLTILFTFALGTATGDLMAESLGLGYSVTGIIVCAVIATVAAAWRLGLNPILSFWIIYILTRPLGASLGDYLSQPSKYGGLGLGATTTSVVFLLAILLTVVFLSVTKRDLIAKKVLKEEVVAQPGSVFWQVAIVVFLFVLVAGTGYHWRHGSLQVEAKSVPPQAGTQDSALSATAIRATTSPVAKVSLLGDISTFQKITQDTLDLVSAGDLSGAKTRVDDLEYEWDNAQSRLKPMNAAKWTEVDNAVDQVLRQVRAVHQDAGACKSSLETLLTVLN